MSFSQQIHFLKRAPRICRIYIPRVPQFRTFATRGGAGSSYQDSSLSESSRRLNELAAKVKGDRTLNRSSILRALASIQSTQEEDYRYNKKIADYEESRSTPSQQTESQRGLLGTSPAGGSSSNPIFVQTQQSNRQLAWGLGTSVFFLGILYLLFFRGGGASSLLGDEFGDIYEEYDKYGNKVQKKKGLQIGPEEAKTNKRNSNLLTFADVAGCEEAKQDLQDIIAYLKNPAQFKRMGIDLPRGVLVVGPPGCGKTLLARAMAGEAGVPFLITDGASFDQMFVGLGSSRVRSLFKRARELAPCIVFIDEIDAVASRRDEPRNPTRATLNQLLVELDGFKKDSGVIIMGATNLPKILDRALTRPGRFDRSVQVEIPDKKARKQIIKMYLKDNAAPDVNLDDLAAGTIGFSGADLKSMVNLAGIEAVKLRQAKISMAALDDAKEIVMMGRARKSMEFTPDTKRLVAFHEGGHALVSIYTEGGSPVYKATLMPRGHALGMVVHTPKDEPLKSREAMLHDLDTAMAGRVAEELVFGTDKITTGASSDFDQATRTAYAMVTKYGMSDRVGPVHLSDQDIDRLSPAMKDVIAEEVRLLLETSYARVAEFLKKRRPQLNQLAEALLKSETLTSDQIKHVVGWKQQDVEPPANSSKSKWKSVVLPRPIALSPK